MAGLSYKKMESFGLEYRALARFLQGKITREESAGAQWFNRVDSNADGVIDAEELAVIISG
jgi:Ca2+-binding EF-hand superfamily protein